MGIPALPREALPGWCAKYLGAPPRSVLFECVHLSAVIGYELEDGSKIVVKARPHSDRLLDCVAVQRHLCNSGFSCPLPLTDPVAVAGWMISAEQYVPDGVQLAQDRDLPTLFAGTLVQLVTMAPPPETVPRLAKPMPWVGWNHAEPGTWPTPDDLAVDLNAHPGPDWLDNIAERIRSRMRHDADPLVVGHGDWESQNLRWNDHTLRCVHDWDSAVSDSEPALAGAAASVYTATGAPSTNVSIELTQEFLSEYQAARGVAWTKDQLEVAWAAGLWVRSFNAKKAVVGGRREPSANRLREELEQRMARTGA